MIWVFSVPVLNTFYVCLFIVETSILTTICYCKREAHVPVWALKINRGNLPDLLIKACRGKISYNSDFVFLRIETLHGISSKKGSSSRWIFRKLKKKKGERFYQIVTEKCKMQRGKFSAGMFHKLKFVLKQAPWVSTEVKLESWILSNRVKLNITKILQRQFANIEMSQEIACGAYFYYS